MRFRRNADIDIRTLERSYTNTGDPETLRRINQHRLRIGAPTALSNPHLILLAEGAGDLLDISWKHEADRGDSKLWNGAYKGYHVAINARRIYDPDSDYLKPFLQIGILEAPQELRKFPQIEIYAEPDEHVDGIIVTSSTEPHSVLPVPRIPPDLPHGATRISDLICHQPWIYSAYDLLEYLVQLAKEAGIEKSPKQLRKRSSPTKKRQRMRQAREIRKFTGLPMNVCLVISRRLLRDDKYSLDDHPLVSKYLTFERGCMDPQCNCKDYRQIEGPKGYITIPMWGGGWEGISKSKTRKYRRNTDEGLRRSEREALGGDPAAEARLLKNKVRAGIIAPHAIVLAKYLRDPLAASLTDEVWEYPFGFPDADLWGTDDDPDQTTWEAPRQGRSIWHMRGRSLRQGASRATFPPTVRAMSHPDLDPIMLMRFAIDCARRVLINYQKREGKSYLLKRCWSVLEKCLIHVTGEEDDSPGFVSDFNLAPPPYDRMHFLLTFLDEAETNTSWASRVTASVVDVALEDNRRLRWSYLADVMECAIRGQMRPGFDQRAEVVWQQQRMIDYLLGRV